MKIYTAQDEVGTAVYINMIIENYGDQDHGVLSLAVDYFQNLVEFLDLDEFLNHYAGVRQEKTQFNRELFFNWLNQRLCAGPQRPRVVPGVCLGSRIRR